MAVVAGLCAADAPGSAGLADSLGDRRRPTYSLGHCRRDDSWTYGRHCPLVVREPTCQ